MCIISVYYIIYMKKGGDRSKAIYYHKESLLEVNLKHLNCYPNATLEHKKNCHQFRSNIMTFDVLVISYISL